MPTRSEDIHLTVEIKNQQPVELIELTKSYVALSNQFNSYLAKTSDYIESRETKLYVKQIRPGSIVAELYDGLTKHALPFTENINTIIGFAGYLKSAYNSVFGETSKKNTAQIEDVVLTTNDYKDLSQIVNPVATDSASQINISTSVNGDINVYLNIDSTEANALQNIIGKKLSTNKELQTNGDVKNSVVMTMWQARGNLKKDIGNKCVIEDISPKSINVIFENNALRERILHHDHNPFKTAFVVDVKLQTVGGKLVAYKVINFHESFEID